MEETAFSVPRETELSGRHTEKAACRGQRQSSSELEPEETLLVPEVPAAQRLTSDLNG